MTHDELRAWAAAHAPEMPQAVAVLALLGERDSLRADAADAAVHRTRVPLDQVDFSQKLPGRKGCGGLFDEDPDRICGV